MPIGILAVTLLNAREDGERDIRGIALAFANAYEKGDSSVFGYVFFDGPHVGDMGGTPEELRDELLPAELRKNSAAPASVALKSVEFSPENEKYGHDVYFVTYSARGKDHKICLHRIDGNWKVDLSYLWMGDWYDWMPGY